MALGPVEICCDAPEYEVVRACEGIGLRSPWDVRWLRLSHLPDSFEAMGIFSVSCWLGYLGVNQQKERRCPCGQVLPQMRLYRILELPPGQNAYRLGQCPRCLTIFWEPD